MAVRNRGSTPLAPGCPAIAPCHLGRGTGLINEHQALGLEVDLPVKPGLPLDIDLGTLLLGGMRGLF
jgi:hypothetical protein